MITDARAGAGGIATVNRHMVRVLRSLEEPCGLRMTVLSFLENDAARPVGLPATAVYRGFRGNKRRLALALFGEVLRRKTFVFDHVTLALPLLPLIVTRVVRAVIIAHGSESWKRIRRTSRWLFAGAALVLTNSHFTLRKMQACLPAFNGVACPLGLAPEFELNATSPVTPQEPVEFENAAGETRQLGPRVCLLVGRMHPREREKGHFELLQVWPHMVREFPDAQLVFVGPGDDRDHVARVAREGGVGDSVFVLGGLDQRVLSELYARCHAFTMPSRQEGFGLVYLEAMNAAKPCLGCWDDGAEDVIVHEETGLLVHDPKDPAELSAALRRLLGNREEARAMGLRGFERLHAQFTAAHVQARLREQLARVL